MKNYKIELNENEFNYVLQALAARPYAEVTGLINKIAEQVKNDSRESGLEDGVKGSEIGK